MKIEEPDWIGEHIWCRKCDVKFQLESEDEEKVTYKRCTYNDDDSIKSRDYLIQCPKCDNTISFELFTKMGNDNALNHSR
jgi:hypothetical protein